MLQCGSIYVKTLSLVVRHLIVSARGVTVMRSKVIGQGNGTQLTDAEAGNVADLFSAGLAQQALRRLLAKSVLNAQCQARILEGLLSC